MFCFQNNITKLDVQFIAKARTNNASVVYSLVPYNSDYMKFRINNNGEVFVTELLDREDQPEYTVCVFMCVHVYMFAPSSGCML